jgi:CRISPR type IV-associated protein Csf3
MEYESIENLKALMNAKIRLIGQSQLFMSGTFVKKNNHGSVAHSVTSKVNAKTKSIYVPVDLAEEVEKWTTEYKKVKSLLKEIDEIGEQIIKAYGAKKKAESKSKKQAE